MPADNMQPRVKLAAADKAVCLLCLLPLPFRILGFSCPLQDWWTAVQNRVKSEAQLMYEAALKRGIAKEQARAVLPEGLTVSRMYMNGTLRSWIHFIELRSGNGTQKEHMQVARACAQVIAKIFPMATDLVAKT